MALLAFPALSVLIEGIVFEDDFKDVLVANVLNCSVQIVPEILCIFLVRPSVHNLYLNDVSHNDEPSPRRKQLVSLLHVTRKHVAEVVSVAFPYMIFFPLVFAGPLSLALGGMTENLLRHGG